MWLTSVTTILLCFSAAVVCIDLPTIVADYVKFKGFDAITLLSCPTRTNVQSWNLMSTKGFLLQLVDFSKGWSLTRLESEANCRQIIVLDLSCPGFESLIRTLSDQDAFKSQCRAFLLYNEKEDETWFERELQPILLNTELTFVSSVCYITAFPKNSISDLLYIHDLWNPGRSQGGALKMDLIGMYNESTNTFVELDSSSATVQRRTNLSELHLQCAIVVTSPFNDTLESYITNNYNPNFDTVHRLNFRTIGLVQDYFNFKLHVKRTHSWGYIQNASLATSFDGMVGMVQRSEVDFGCSPAWFRTERLQVVDYGSQTWAIRPIFLFRHPNTKGLGRNVFLEPFENSVWTVLLISSIIIVLMMTNTVQQEKYTMGQLESREKEVGGMITWVD